MNDFVIVIFGAGGVGKSAITTQYVTGMFVDKYDPTIEDCYRESILVDGHSYNLEILDTSGTDQFTQLRDSYIKRGHGFVLVFSVTSRSSLDELEIIYDEIVGIKHYELDTISIVLVANKCDIESRQIDSETAHKQARKWNCTLVECSARTRTNVDTVFITVVKDVICRQAKHRKRKKCNVM